jgi:rare lipoprotein A
MLKLVATFLIIIFGVSFFFFKKNQKLELKLKHQIELNDSLQKTIANDSIIIDTLKKADIINFNSSAIENIKVLDSSKPIKTATWYEMHGSKTYSGEIFHKDSLIAAYYTKMGTYLKVTNLKNQKSVIVKVVDRMGSSNKNKIDLSKKAFNMIGSSSSGRIKVSVEEIK